MLDIPIAPILAGAGVSGLTIGFGAQALVRDVISGVFSLVEGVFRVGEDIESGSSTKGTVERITLRTVALCHQNGPLHFVPCGSLGTVRDTSRDRVVDEFELPLPAATDSEQVRRLVERIGAAMREDPALGPLLQEPLKARLHRIEPGLETFRCKFRTTPDGSSRSGPKHTDASKPLRRKLASARPGPAAWSCSTDLRRSCADPSSKPSNLTIFTSSYALPRPARHHAVVPWRVARQCRFYHGDIGISAFSMAP